MYYIMEFELMRQVLFALQGMNGSIIRQDADGRFTITKENIHKVDPTQRMLLEKLTSFGWLVNKIKNHIDSVKKDPTQGKVSQQLAVALKEELDEYYKLVTDIDERLKNCAKQDNGRTRASTPTSELYSGAEIRAPKTSATYESLQTAVATNGYNGHNHHLPLSLHQHQHQVQLQLQQYQPIHHHLANSDDGFGSQVYSVPSSNVSPTIPSMTLHQIHVQTLEHYFRLKTLAMLVECCKGERGGHLARIVYRFMQQGDKQIRYIITRILSKIVLPIRTMLSQWIFHGEIQDSYDEFFICLDDHVAVDGLTSSVTMMSLSNNTLQSGFLNQYQKPADNKYHLPPHMQSHRAHHHLPISSSMSSLSSASVDERQYIINDYMMPGFITRQQANKILATGKAIHLLRKVCADSISSSVPGYDDLKKSFESTNIESLFRAKGILNCGEENEFEYLLNTAYKEVSQKALELLFGNYKLRSHFRGLRQYLLLGQGDFIRHLMDLLGTELDKPSSECRFHNILSVLESAMRSTNAQYDEPDVTNRLDCRLLDATSPHATGWDIFSLVYKVDGPISTIFTEEKMRDYIEIFRRLWRTKRVEHVLTSIWSSQMYYSKEASKEAATSEQFSKAALLKPVLHRANILLSDMIHFMQHFQNFIMFEVVECSWVELVAATDVAKDVDDVIAAHDSYLKKIKLGTVCQKDTLFDCIWEFQQLMASLWKEIDGGLCSRPETDQQPILSDYLSKIRTLATKFQVNRQIKFEKQQMSETFSKF